MKIRKCLWCTKPMSEFDNPRKLCHGDRYDRFSCARSHRKKQSRERFSKSPQKRAKLSAYGKEYRKTHPDKTANERKKKWRDLHAVPGGMRSEARKRAARENAKKATAARMAKFRARQASHN